MNTNNLTSEPAEYTVTFVNNASKEQREHWLKGGDTRVYSQNFELSPGKTLDVREIRQRDGSTTYSVYPKQDGLGNWDAGGYRFFKEASTGEWRAHRNGNPMSLAQYLENAFAFDKEVANRTDNVLRDYGIAADGNDTLRKLVADHVFVSGPRDGQKLLTIGSPTLRGRFDTLQKLGVPNNEAFALAWLSEANTYHKGNARRVLGRARDVTAMLNGTKNPITRKFLDDYNNGAGTVVINRNNRKLTYEAQLLSQQKAAQDALVTALGKIGSARKKRPTQQDIKGGRAIRAAEGGGDTGPASSATEVPAGSTQPQENGGPRIVVNPKVFSDKRDALCVAMNEAFRVIMEMNGFEPVSEPTEKQRKFFADTAYADDELMLRRTILARICTFDTSVTDPTTEQLQESVEFLETVMEIGAPQNEWEQRAVQRIHDVLAKASETGAAPTENTKGPEAPTDTAGTTRGAVGGGETIEDKTQTYTPTNANYTPTNANYTPTNANYTPTDANYTPTNEGYKAGALGLPSQRGGGTVDNPVSSQRPEGSIEKSWVLGRDNASRSDGSIEKSWVLTRGNSSQEDSVLQDKKIRQRVLNAGGLPFEV